MIIDEFRGRKIAQALGLDIIGTIGIIALAGNHGIIIDVMDTISKMVNKGFRLSDDLFNKINEKYGKN